MALLKLFKFFNPDKELSNTRNAEAKLSNIKTELLEATLQLDRDQLASDKSTTYAQKVKKYALKIYDQFTPRLIKIIFIFP